MTSVILVIASISWYIALSLNKLKNCLIRLTRPCTDLKLLIDVVSHDQCKCLGKQIRLDVGEVS